MNGLLAVLLARSMQDSVNALLGFDERRAHLTARRSADHIVAIECSFKSDGVVEVSVKLFAELA
jgi:hypothetical protein